VRDGVLEGGDGQGSTVQVLDPQVMSSVIGEPRLQPMADEAGRRLDAALHALAG
jgi:hypothetical protein